jgi:hypothetical protein
VHGRWQISAARTCGSDNPQSDCLLGAETLTLNHRYIRPLPINWFIQLLHVLRLTPLGLASGELGGLIGLATKITFYNRTLYRSEANIDTLMPMEGAFISSLMEL